MAGWTLTIGGTDYSNATDFSSWRINASARHRGSTASGTITIGSKNLPRPRGFQEVRLSYAGGATLFGGVLMNVKQSEFGPGIYDYPLQAMDYTRWMDHMPAAATKTYSGTASAIFTQLLLDWVTCADGPGLPQSLVNSAFGVNGPAVPLYAPGGGPAMDTSRIITSPLNIKLYQPNYIAVSQACDQIAKLAEAVWYIDVDRKPVFADAVSAYANGALQAPLPLGNVSFFDQTWDGAQGVLGWKTLANLPYIDGDNPFFRVGYAQPAGQTTPTAYRNLILEEDVSNTISGVHLRDYQDVTTSQLTESPDAATANTPNKKLIGDGVTRFFNLSNKPVDKGHTTVNIRLAGHGAIQKTYNTANGNILDEYKDGQPSDGATNDVCYVCPSNQGLRFNVAPPNTQEVEVIYNYYYTSSNAQQNAAIAAEIAAREGFGGGWYYQPMADSSLTAPMSLNEGTPPWLAAEIIQIQRYARFKYLARFNTYLAGFMPGMQFGIVSPNRGDQADAATGFNTWGKTFTQRFFVTQVEKRLVGADGTVDTAVEACSDIFGL